MQLKHQLSSPLSANKGTNAKPNLREKCSSCGKPLGATVKKCFECGGKHPPRKRETGEQWRILLGVA